MPEVFSKNTPVTSLWIGRKLDTISILGLTSWLYAGHPVELYVYDEIENVPDGVKLRDANDVLKPKDYPPFVNGVAILADIWRYLWLYEHGGFWVDTDSVAITGNFPAMECFCVNEQEQPKWQPAEGYLYFPKKHPFIKQYYDFIKDPLRTYDWEGETAAERKVKFRAKGVLRAQVLHCMQWGYIGPVTEKHIIQHLGLQHIVLPYYMGHLVPYYKLAALYQNGNGFYNGMRLTDLPALHINGSILRRSYPLSSAAKGSPLRTLFNKYELSRLLD